MEIWKAIYNAYSTKELSLLPLKNLPSRDRLQVFVESYVENPKDREYLEELIDDLCNDIEIHNFHAGMSVALQLLAE